MATMEKNKKRIIAIMPARMAASRFPGKPLAQILDLPMVEHVRRRVLLSNAVSDVYVATCDEEIKGTVESYGGKAIMTAKTHQRCTDRIEEASYKIKADIIVIVQADEPLFDPAALGLLVRPMIRDNDIQCANLLSVINDDNDLNDVDVVKAVLDKDDYVMYYSRSPIPFMRTKNNCPRFRQTGISAFTKSFLHKFSKLNPTPKEIAESIDFLRILEHRYRVLGVVYPQRTVGVDREEDIAEVEEILHNDPTQQAFYQKILKMNKKVA